jgi:hypothetical protein
VTWTVCRLGDPTKNVRETLACGCDRRVDYCVWHGAMRGVYVLAECAAHKQERLKKETSK